MKRKLAPAFLCALAALGIAAGAAAQESRRTLGRLARRESAHPAAGGRCKERGRPHVLGYRRSSRRPMTSSAPSSASTTACRRRSRSTTSSPPAPPIWRRGVEQEIGADPRTIDVAAIGSPTWVFSRVNEGDALQYASPHTGTTRQHLRARHGQGRLFALTAPTCSFPCGTAERTTLTAIVEGRIGAVPAERMSIGDVSKSVTYLDAYSGLQEDSRSGVSSKHWRKLQAALPAALRAELLDGWSPART